MSKRAIADTRRSMSISRIAITHPARGNKTSACERGSEMAERLKARQSESQHAAGCLSA